MYGDWLHQQGDARAELLTLQLAPNPSKTQLERAKTLVREHGRSWLGPLAPAVARNTEQFSRGFPSAGALSFANTALRDTLSGHPAWNTFTALAGADASFLVGTELRGLEALFLTGDEVLERLGRRAWPFRRLGRLSVRWCSSFALAALLDLDAPVLRHVDLSPQQGERERLPGALSKLAPVLERLESLKVDGLRHTPAIAALLAGSALRRLELDVPSVTFHRVPAGWALELRPAASLPELNEFLPLVTALVEPDSRWGARRDGVRSALHGLGLALVQL